MINTLPKYSKRRFIDDKVDFCDVIKIKFYYNELEVRRISSSEELEQWILDRSEMESVLGEVGSILYINMTCQTNNEEKAKKYKSFIQNIIPALSPLEDKLNIRFLDLVKQYPLNAQKYLIYIREIELDVELFEKKNIPLITELSLLSQKYQTLCGGMTVMFENEERTLSQMEKYLLQTDRSLREKAWRSVQERRLRDSEKCEDIFDKMLTLRCQVAKNTKCRGFAEYKFCSLKRFDYTVADCKQYHQTIEEYVVPLQKKLNIRRKKLLGLEVLYPWDTLVDPLGREPLMPFKETKELEDGVRRIFDKVDSKLSSFFQGMVNLSCLDLASRKGKAPGGYQATLDEARKPFIFMNAVGVDMDVRTLLHESGHAFHSLLSAPLDIFMYRHSPMEFCEVASMTMELVGGEYMNEFYNYEDAKRSHLDHWENIISLLTSVAMVDAFQHWIYENPDHLRKDRREKWLSLCRRFGGGGIDWTGLEEFQGYAWHRILHIFEVPFYYIEYGIAQLGALQIWLNSKKDKKKVLSAYMEALSLGGSRPLPELFECAGICFDFSKDVIIPLVTGIEEELNM